MALADRAQEILKRIPDLPDSAAIPIAAAAVHDGVCARTVRRCYPLVDISPGRKGVLVSYLRRHTRAAEKECAA